ncbi:MAG: glycosyltransferase [Thaumarchaeota archaeon]|nr:glycosyltransferase [Nitrososphaerota archaeon]
MSQTRTEKFFWRKDPTEEEPQENTAQKSKEPTPVEKVAEVKTTELKSNILIGVPCHNSESTIARTIVHLSGLGAEIVVCDDGSTDATEDIAKKMGCRVIKHPRELGRSDSVTSLFLAAKKLKVEVLLTVGASTKVSLTDLSQLIDLVQRGDVDIAIGSIHPEEELEIAHHEGRLMDRDSLVRAYGKKTLTMISPPGTGSVVVEKEVLEFADQQGLKVREYYTSGADTVAETVQSIEIRPHFESRFMTFVANKHPLVFLGIPSLAFLYYAVLEAVLNTNFAQLSVSTWTSFGLSIATSPMLLVSVALSIGCAVLYTQQGIEKRIEKIKEFDSRL